MLVSYILLGCIATQYMHAAAPTKLTLLVAIIARHIPVQTCNQMMHA